MKNFKKIFFFLLVLSLFSCKKNDSKNENIQFKKLEDNHFKYFLYFSKNNDSRTVKYDSLIVENKSDNSKQKLSLIHSQNRINEIDFKLVDVNFDNYNDISLVSFEGLPNVSYYFWIYDVSNKKFLREKSLEKLINPEVISDKKEICSKWRVGTDYFNLYKFFWDKNVLTVKEKYEETWSPLDGKGHFKISRLENGKWNISEKQITERTVENMECR